MRENVHVRRVAVLVSTWEHVHAWLENQKLLAAREGAYKAEFDQF